MLDSVAEHQPLSASRRLRDALRGAGVAFVHWKSNSHLAEALAGQTDLDLFVRPSDKSAFAEAARACGGMRVLSQPWASYPGVEDWLVFDQGSGRFLHLHVHYMLLTGLKRVKHLCLPWHEALLANMRHDAATGWPIPTAEMELLTLLVRIWAKMPPWRRLLKPKLPRHIREELRWLLQATTPAAALETAEKLNLSLDAGSLRALFDSKDDEAIIMLSRRLYGQMRPYYRMSWGRALSNALILNGRAQVSRALKPRMPLTRHGKTLLNGGALIAVIGADGSGKSTLCRDLVHWLDFKLDAHLLYMGSGDGAGGFVQRSRRRAKAWLHSKRPEEDGTQRVSPARQRASSLWERLYRLLDLHLMRRKVRLLRAARRLARSGSIILLERYPQDQVEGLSDGPRLQAGRSFAWAAAAERKLYEEARRIGPDLVIRLHIDPQIAHARKPDHDLDIIARKCRIVDGLEFPMSTMVEIDAVRPYGHVVMDAKLAIWHFLRERQA